MKNDGNELAEAYLSNVASSNPRTAKAYRVRVRILADYLKTEKNTTIDETIPKLRTKDIDPYALLAAVAAFTVTKRQGGPRYQTQTIKTIRNFLEYHDVEISLSKFRLKVKLQRVIRRKKLGLSKEDVREIVRGCEGNMRLLTYVMFLACTGMRAKEALQVKIEDLKLDADPPFVFVRGENTKTAADRTVYLTGEMVQQLRKYLVWKYRERRTKYDHHKDTTIYGKFEPKYNQADYVFMPYKHAGGRITKIDNLYNDTNFQFGRVLQRIGKGQFEPGGKRREIGFHSFRRYVKTTISNLSYGDFSEYFIGHIGSEYYTAPEKEKVEIFRKIEPYLTIMDFASLEAKQRDIGTQMDDSKDRIRKLEEKLAKYDELLQEAQHAGRVTLLPYVLNAESLHDRFENEETKHNMESASRAVKHISNTYEEIDKKRKEIKET